MAVVRAGMGARLRNAALLAGLVLWMIYTRVFWAAQAVHATVPSCPFLAITGHPCPFCGGTRSFAYMWQGDLRRAAALYPLGPLLFAGTAAAIAALAVGLVANLDLRVRVPDALWRRFLLWVAVVLGISWTLKLTVLPN